MASLGAGSLRKRNLLGRGKGSSFTVLLEGVARVVAAQKKVYSAKAYSAISHRAFLRSGLEFNLLAVCYMLGGSKPNSWCGLFVVELHLYLLIPSIALLSSLPRDARTGDTLVEGTPGSYITSRVGLRW